MMLTTPTTKDISDNIIAHLEGSLNQTIPLLPKAFTRVLAKALAGVFMLLYKYAGFMLLQVFIRTASSGETIVNGKIIKPLIEWGRLVGVGDPVAATNAELSIRVGVLNQTGSLPAGSHLINSNNGVTYITLATVILDATTVTVSICAVSDQVDGGGAGIIGNLEPGDIVSFANSIPNVFRDAVVLSQIVTGADPESVDSYRQRILDRMQKRPQGGAYADYELWGEEVAGILNIYPYTSDLPGQVDIYVESATEADGIPTNAQLTAVRNSIELDQNGLASRRPANAYVNVYPISRITFNVTVRALLVENPATVQAAITEALTKYFYEIEPFIGGLSVLPRNDTVSMSGVGGVVNDVARAYSGIFSNVTVRYGISEVDTYTLGIGEKCKLGSVTFI